MITSRPNDHWGLKKISLLCVIIVSERKIEGIKHYHVFLHRLVVDHVFHGHMTCRDDTSCRRELRPEDLADLVKGATPLRWSPGGGGGGGWMGGMNHREGGGCLR